jgi:magnesium transporter
VEVIDGRVEVADWTAPHAPICVIVPPSLPGRAFAAATWLDADRAAAEQALTSSHRRPFAYANGKQISVVAFGTDRHLAGHEVHLYVGSRGLVVVCPEPLVPVVTDVVSRVRRGPDEALAALLLALANHATAVMEDLSEEADRLDQDRVGLASDSRRRVLSRLRQRLFALQQLWAAHHLLCATDGIVAGALAEASDQRTLRHAGAVFEANSAAAAQVYARLGDTVSRQTAVINERLTLVTVLFLPLTVISSFFGMNFAWMTDHIGSAAAFVVLGIVMPVGLVVATVLGLRMFSGR